MSLTMAKAYHYIFSTASIYSDDIYNGFLNSGILFGSSLFKALAALLVIIIYILMLMTKLIIMVFPHLISTFQSIVEFHRTKLSYSDIIVEFSVILLFTLFLLFRKRILNSWRIFEKSVARKSKVAANAAPHVAFFSFALILAIIGRNFLVHITSPSVLPVVTLLIPMYTTIADLVRLSNKENNIKNEVRHLDRQMLFKQKLTLWVVLAAYHTLATGFNLIPFSSRISYLLPFVREMSVIVIIWAQLSYKFTNIVFDAAKPFLKYLANAIPSSNFGASVASTGSSFLSMLRMMRIINAKYETFFKALMQDSVIVLIAFGFMFTPWRISYIGVIIVALLFPAFKSSNNILETSDHRSEDEKKFWLQYWICLGFLWVLKCYGFKVWPSVMLIATLWLQHSLFKGASSLLSSFSSSWCALVDRHDRIQQEKSLGSTDSDLNNLDQDIQALESIEDSDSHWKNVRQKSRSPVVRSVITEDDEGEYIHIDDASEEMEDGTDDKKRKGPFSSNINKMILEAKKEI
jgi:hypothetical protein